MISELLLFAIIFGLAVTVQRWIIKPFLLSLLLYVGFGIGNGLGLWGLFLSFLLFPSEFFLKYVCFVMVSFCSFLCWAQMDWRGGGSHIKKFSLFLCCLFFFYPSRSFFLMLLLSRVCGLKMK